MMFVTLALLTSIQMLIPCRKGQGNCSVTVSIWIDFSFLNAVDKETFYLIKAKRSEIC